MKLKDALYDAMADGLTYPEMAARFPAYAKITIYQALSALKSEGRARAEKLPVHWGRGSNRSRGPRTRWVRIC